MPAYRVNLWIKNEILYFQFWSDLNGIFTPKNSKMEKFWFYASKKNPENTKNAKNSRPPTIFKPPNRLRNHLLQPKSNVLNQLIYFVALFQIEMLLDKKIVDCHSEILVYFFVAVLEWKNFNCQKLRLLPVVWSKRICFRRFFGLCGFRLPRNGYP
jgi:hypothetical protein